MSSKSFVKVLRKVIREEVRAAVKEILTEQTNSSKQVINNLGLSEAMHKPKSKKKFTKNSMLNDILNETAGSADFSTMREGPAVMQEDIPSLGNFKSSMAESFGMNRQPQALATTDVNGKAVNMNDENVAKTLNVMTKDYRALMKAIDKKKSRR